MVCRPEEDRHLEVFTTRPYGIAARLFTVLWNEARIHAVLPTFVLLVWAKIGGVARLSTAKSVSEMGVKKLVMVFYERWALNVIWPICREVNGNNWP